MFGQFYGFYLVKNNIISAAQFEEVIEYQKTVRVKLGLIAVAEKLITAEQADELNRQQATMDKRFGDIAVEKGYLTTEQVEHLLSLQGSPYHSFVQAITDKGFMKLEEVESQLLAYQKDNQFTDGEMDALKNDDTNGIVSMFVKVDNSLLKELIGLTLRNLIRFIHTEIYMERSYTTTEYPFQYLASQSLEGNHSVFLGFAGKDNALLSIANPYAKEEFDSMNEDSFDSICEFINCVNGLFASKLSQEDIDLDMLPPLSYSNQTIVSKNSFCIVPIYINGAKVELVILVDGELTIQ